MSDMNKLRQLIGWMCFALPIVDAIFALFGFRYFGVEPYYPSISGTHYYNSFLVFEGLMFLVSSFFLFYKGYDIKDQVLCKIAGAGGFLLAFFPCSPPSQAMVHDPWNILMLPHSVTNIIHLVGAGAFFVMLFWIIMFQFTKSGSKGMTPGKRKKNITYRACGVSILIGILMCIFDNLRPTDIGPFGLMYIGEVVLLWSTGIAWVLKGNWLMKKESLIKS